MPKPGIDQLMRVLEAVEKLVNESIDQVKGKQADDLFKARLRRSFSSLPIFFEEITTKNVQEDLDTSTVKHIKTPSVQIVKLRRDIMDILEDFVPDTDLIILNSLIQRAIDDFIFPPELREHK